MLHEKFKELCKAVELKWTPKKGAVALLSTSGGRVNLRLCAGPLMNTGVMAENCRLWNEAGVLLYEGDLRSVDLQKVLTSRHVCRAEITDAESIGRKTGIIMCLGSSRCSRSRCAARREHAERAAVQGT